LGEKWPVNLACDSDFHVNRSVLLHAVKLRHGTDGFTSRPKEGMLWNFSPEKSDGFGRVRTTRPLKPLGTVMSSSTLLNHRQQVGIAVQVQPSKSHAINNHI
jgi:hypothetical protein